MKAHLADLAASPESPAFRTCQRVYNRVQRILFEDPEDTNDAPRRSVLPFLPLFEARRPVYPRHARSAESRAGFGSCCRRIGMSWSVCRNCISVRP